MNTIEERIRAAAQAAAETVPPDGVPPLRLPPEHRRARRWSPWVLRLAPIAAAVAVVVIVIAAVSVTGTGTKPAGPATGGATTGPSAPGPVQAGPPISSYVDSGEIPAYYVGIVSRDDDPEAGPAYAVVAATVSGKTLATIQPSVPHGTIAGVTAAADDRTFVLDEERFSTDAGDMDFGTRTFYEFRLNTAGRPGPLTRVTVPVPPGLQLDGMALSPDGSKLALALETDVNTGAPTTLVELYTLATGAVRTWTGHGGSIGGKDDARSLSWTSDGRTLAFDWNTNRDELRNFHGKAQLMGVPGSVRLLRVDAPGRNLLATSQPLVPAEPPSPQPFTGYCEYDSIITPDGSKVVCGEVLIQILTGGLLNAESEFHEYSIATGQLTTTLGYWKFHNVIPNIVGVLWSNNSGSVLIGVIPGGGQGRIGVISGNSFTPLPAAASAESAAVADDQSGTW